MKKLFLALFMTAIAINAMAVIHNLPSKVQNTITEEAEDWIDDMPSGIQDRLADAVLHAQKGFFSEINYFRSFSDTTGIGRYKVKITDMKGGENSEIPMRIYRALSENQGFKPTLIYFHGGGWSLGSINTTDRFCRALASDGNLEIISIEYPLAPENPSPAALQTALNAVNYIYKNIDKFGGNKDYISIGGDGAGGNIALNVYNCLPESVSIRSLVLYYPLLKTSGELNADTKRKYARGYGFDSRLWETFIDAYNENPSKDFNKKLPPTLLISAGRDIIIDEIEDFVDRHPEVIYVIYSGALHGFITDNRQNTAFNETVSLTGKFLEVSR